MLSRSAIPGRETHMKSRTSMLFAGALFSVISVSLLAGCAGKNDPINAASQADKKAGVAIPSITETKAIAEEAFIYGLPIVMNYAVMNEFVVDKNSGQYKAPFNRLATKPRLHLQGHGRRHAQQRHAVFDALAGSARRADGDLGAGGGKKALLLGAVDRWQYLQLRLHWQSRHWQRCRRLSGRRPRLERRDARRIKKVFHSTTPFALTIFRTQLFNAEDMPNVVKVQAATRRSRSPRS